MNEQQKHELYLKLENIGLRQRQIEDILLLLRFKPERVQLAFYYRAMGKTYQEIGGFLGVSESWARRIFDFNCSDIKKYLNELT